MAGLVMVAEQGWIARRGEGGGVCLLSSPLIQNQKLEAKIHLGNILVGTTVVDSTVGS